MKNIYTIPSNHAFVDALASGIIARFGEEGLAKSNMLLLLPNRRSATALKDAFLRLGNGKASLLPRMMPLGDMDEEELFFSLLAQEKILEIPPAIAPLRQQILLAKLTHEWRKKRYGDEAMFVHSLKLAGELVRFLSEVEREQLSLENLESLYPDDYQEHWKDTLEFLKILLEYWPDLLQEQHATTMAQYRNQMMEMQAHIWQENPPEYPIIAAGVTGTFPAANHLLHVISTLPNGHVVLPGLDQYMDENAWQYVAQTHPQYEMKQLLSTLKCERKDVEKWHDVTAFHTASDERLKLVSQLMLPAEAVEAWRHYRYKNESEKTLSRVEASSLHEEAGVIALMLREVLETEGKTAALVTHDRKLASHVVMALKRWQIDVNDSAGKPMAESAIAVFLRLIASQLENESDLISLLACLKHPYCTVGYAPLTALKYVRHIERRFFRGVCRFRDLNALHAHLLLENETELADYIARVMNAFSPLYAIKKSGKKYPILALLRKLIEVAEQLSATEKEVGVTRLWSSDASEQFQQWYVQLEHIRDLPQEVYVFEAENLLHALLENVSYRPRYGLHPRLHILGPLEARLQSYDRLILGGLNEGSWPSLPAADPWMSRPMRTAFGLPLPERRIGQAAHDFMQYFCAKEVFLTRSRKVDGAETTPSRWWMRLETVLKASDQEAILTPEEPWLEWHHSLYENTTIEMLEMPHPTPPLSLRPREISATNIEHLQQNPYAIYAKYILNLKPLEEIDKTPSFLEFGNFIHKVIERFHASDWQQESDVDVLSNRWLFIAEKMFEEQQIAATIKTIWWPRLMRIAPELMKEELARRPNIKHIYSETTGYYSFDTKAGEFTLKATADRMEINHENTLTVIDYKTGYPPLQSEVASGKKSQLPLEALIALRAGYKEINETISRVNEMAYWHISGRTKPLNIISFPTTKMPEGEMQKWVEDAEAGLKKLVDWFADESHAYVAYPHGSEQLKFDDYAHLIRKEEWEI